MKKTKIIIPFLLLCTIISAYYFSNNNSCMRKAPHYDSFIYFNQPVGQFEMSQNIADESIDEKKYKRFKRTEDGMKAFGKYVPLPKDEPYFVDCTFGEVTYADGEPVQFTHFVRHRDMKIDVLKGKWEYDQQLTYGMYYYRVSKEPFANSLEDSGLDDVETILLDDGVEALFRINLMEWKDGRFYYQLHHRNSYHDPSTMTFLANSSRVNVSSVPVWVNGIN